MKRLSLLLFVIILGLSSYAQKGCLGLINNFEIDFRGNWDQFEYAVVSNVTSSTPASNIIAINVLGGANILLSHYAFENTNPCYVLSNIHATITVYKRFTGQELRSARVHLYNLFYFDYPINVDNRYCEYQIPTSAWQISQYPTEAH
jgi:hypothetical protein